MKKVEIEYCVTCNYRPIAASLGFSIEKETGIKPQLVPSHTAGAFEIVADGLKIFSKTETGKFPDHAGVIGKLKGGDR